MTPIMNATYQRTTLSAFLAAVEASDLAYLKLLIEKLQFDLKQKYENDRTILHKIVSEGMDDYPNNNAGNESELFRYIAEGKYEELKSLLHQKAFDLNQLSQGHQTPLQLAVTSKEYDDMWTRINILKLLLNHGAYPNLGRYPLLSAAYQIHKKQAASIIEVLGTYGTDPTLIFRNSSTVLTEVALDGQEELVNLLIKMGASPHASEQGLRSLSLYEQITTNSMGRTHRLTPVICDQISKIEKPKGHGYIDLAEIIAFLKACGADLNAQDIKGDTPLHLANSSNKVEALLANDADVKVINSEHETPFHAVVRKNFYSSPLEKMLTKGADINAQDMNGFTPLRKAIELNVEYSCLPEFLLQQGADFTLADKHGISPLVASIIGKKTYVIGRLTKQVNVNDYSSYYACYPIHLALDPQYYIFTTMKCLVTNGASLLKPNAQGQNAFDVVKAHMEKYRHYGFRNVFYSFHAPRTHRNGMTEYGEDMRILDVPHLHLDIFNTDELISYRKPFIANSMAMTQDAIFSDVGVEILAQLLMQIINKNLQKEFRYLLEIDLIKDFMSLWQLLLDEKKFALQKIAISHAQKRNDERMLHDMLRLAVIDTEADTVAFLLQDKALRAKVNEMNEQGKTLLHEAILNIEIHVNEMITRHAHENYKYVFLKKRIKKPGAIGIEDTAKIIEILVAHEADVNLPYQEKSPLYYAASVKGRLIPIAVTNIISTLLTAQAEVKSIQDLLFLEHTSNEVKLCFCRFFIQKGQWDDLFLIIKSRSFNLKAKNLALGAKDMQNFAQAIAREPISPKLTKIKKELAKLYDEVWNRQNIVEQTISGQYQDIDGFARRDKLKTIRHSNNWAILFKHTTGEAMLLANTTTPLNQETSKMQF